MGKLDGRVAIVSGAARGQGEQIARVFAEEGARVIVTDILDGQGREVARSLGDQGHYVHLDVTQEQDWKEAVAAAIAKWGAIDILANNAGIMLNGHSILEGREEDFHRILNTNLVGAWLGVKTVAPVMVARKKGAIVNTCSAASLWGLNGLAFYSASKWGLRGLTKVAAMELGHKGVRVNAVMPGGINTPMANVTNEPPEALDKYFQTQTIQRIGNPIEVARCTLFLVSDDASYLCGTEMAVDGGHTLGLYSPLLPGAPDGLFN